MNGNTETTGTNETPPPRLIICEGKFDKFFVSGLWKSRKISAITPIFHEVPKSGRWRNAVKAHLNEAKVRGAPHHIGIILDSDGFEERVPISSALDRVKGLFHDLDWSIPKGVQAFLAVSEEPQMPLNKAFEATNLFRYDDPAYDPLVKFLHELSAQDPGS